MDSVELYSSSLGVQLTHYEQRVSDLQRQVDTLAWWNIPQSIVSELGHVSDYVLGLLREAQLEYQRQRFAKAQNLLKTLVVSIEQLSHLVSIGGQLSVLKPRLEQLVEYKLDSYSPLVSYRRALLRKFSVVVGMARRHQGTVDWQLDELRRGLEELESYFSEQLAKGHWEVGDAPRSLPLSGKKVMVFQAR